MEIKRNLIDLTIEELEEELSMMGQPKFRAKQIFQWCHKGVMSIDEMTNISKDLRQILKDKFRFDRIKIRNRLVSNIDGTIKYVLEYADGNIIESVLMKYKHGFTACISSQAGCKMGCKFCASTGIDFGRNLTGGEMVDQILTIQRDQGVRVGNVVIMGIGEPLDNYDNLIKFLKLVNHKDGLNIGLRHISVSTCGLVPKIIKLAEENLPVTLSISLHAPNNEIREKIMPVNKTYSIDKLIEACKIYTEVTGRRVTFEYAMVSDLNDSLECAKELSKRLKGMLCHVNLIPVNSIEGNEFRRTKMDKIQKFKNILENNGIETTVRRELGSDINAACGQLRKSITNDLSILKEQ
ncbi:MAG TPA: 23S rRNA (adenine(2503)-C(2))-methyltransferase RlmN [Pseudobacteroides sp.]|nr:23S rRNA (adenine(2503)-C(2))-methyltransferase RlmN [Pseudobacteroides sp.]